MTLFPRSPISRSEPRRRRNDGGEVSTLSFDVTSLEFVPAGEELGLLRLSGRWTAPDVCVLHDVVLVAAAGADETEIAPLPDPSGSLPTATPDGESWRAAFSIRTALAVGDSTEFALRVDGHETIRLPRPGELPEPALAEPPAAPSAPPAQSAPADQTIAAELSRVHADLGRMRIQLEVERRRYAALEEEIRDQAALENDLRNQMAMQQAELAVAAQASERARRAERERERAMSTSRGSTPAGRPLDPDLLERITRAHRAADAA